MKTLSDVIRPTTFLRPQKLRDQIGLDLTIAAETFQHTGSFKFRAAYNTAFSVAEEHLIAASSGNFGQALAYACKLIGKWCHVVMPANSASVKIEAVRSYGAVVDLVDTAQVKREERVSQLMEVFPDAYRASAYDDPLVIEGNSTLGREIAAFDCGFDAVVVPVGGGGLISGIAQGFARNVYETELVGAEPALGNDASRSMAFGRVVKNESEPQTVADGARTLSLGSHNWEIIRKHVNAIIEVSEENIIEGLRSFFENANLKVEPTGALALGAVLENRELFENKRICLVVSGGNVDPAVYARLLAR